MSKIYKECLVKKKFQIGKDFEHNHYDQLLIRIKVSLRSEKNLQEIWKCKHHYLLLTENINLYNQFGKSIWQYLVISKGHIPYNSVFSYLGIIHAEILRYMCQETHTDVHFRQLVKNYEYP